MQNKTQRNPFKYLSAARQQPKLCQTAFVLVIAAFVMGYLLRGSSPDASHNTAVPSQHNHETDHSTPTRRWTCSMHPQIRQPDPGQCPICGMDLIPQTDDAQDTGNPRELKLSPAAMKLAAIQTAPVQKKYVSKEIRMVGKVAYDETRLVDIAARIPARIDRLYVDYTGMSVRKGDHLAKLYSPELFSAQQELLQALKNLRQAIQQKHKRRRSSALSTLKAARKKLRLWGITPSQIKTIEKRGKLSENLTLYSPISGIVVRKNTTEGQYVNTGSTIYTITDLSYVWVKLAAYESDLQWLRYGQMVELQTIAHPGEIFTGKIVFIDPVLNPDTRTINVRVTLPNPDLKLKPEMFVKAVVHSQLSTSGKVVAADLANKWISPMHPEIVKDTPGNCDICGMKLVKAAQLGYVSAAARQQEAPLIIPVTAPLITGRRAVVYVAHPENPGHFEGREVILGAQAGAYYVVKKGLKEGEQVVVNGNFKLDSDLQIKAKPSMMNQEQDVAAAAETEPPAPRKIFSASSQFQKSLEKNLNTYFPIQQALSQDKLNAAKFSSERFQRRLSHIDSALLQGEALQYWITLSKELQKAGQDFSRAENLAAARQAFHLLSEALYTAIRAFGTSSGQSVYRYYCPMAFDNKGAYWLQNKQGVENPYFGAAMFGCGEEREILVDQTAPEE